jgi:hypothetical protein
MSLGTGRALLLARFTRRHQWILVEQAGEIGALVQQVHSDFRLAGNAEALGEADFDVRAIASTMTLPEVLMNESARGLHPCTAMGGQLYSQAICGMRDSFQPDSRATNAYSSRWRPLPLNHALG